MSTTKQTLAYSDGYSIKPRLQFALLNTIFKRSIAILLFLAVWESLPRLGIVSSAFLPPLSTVLDTTWQLYQSGQLGTHFLASIRRSIIGFGLALAIAIPLGLIIGWYKLVAETLNPLLSMLSTRFSPITARPINPISDFSILISLLLYKYRHKTMKKVLITIPLLLLLLTGCKENVKQYRFEYPHIPSVIQEKSEQREYLSLHLHIF